MTIWHLNQNKEWTPTKKESYRDESHLQDVLAKNVNILPLDEMGYEMPFITIGKEVELQNGALDLLAVSPQGHIALIETKLDKNPEVKRTVVGQILGYVAYLWNKNYKDIEKDFFRKYLAKEDIQFEGGLAEYVEKNTSDPDFSEVDFKNGIEERLRLGRFTLLIVVDQTNQELEDIANYLNDRTGQEIDFYVIGVGLIGDRAEKFLIPELANPRRKNVTFGGKKSQNSYDRTPIAKEEFLEMLSAPERKLANRLLDEFEGSKNVEVIWRKNGFSLLTNLPEELREKRGLEGTASFSYLFLRADDKNNEKLEFWYPEYTYKKSSILVPIIERYVKFYRSIDGYDKKSKMKETKDLSVFNKEKTSQLITLIKNTAKKLKEG